MAGDGSEWWKGRLESVMNVLANLGFVMRDTRRTKFEAPDREWGISVDGFALSINTVEPKPTISVALKNTGEVERLSALPGWLSYYAVSITGPDGVDAEPTAYGRQLLDPSRAQSPIQTRFPAGGILTTEIPIATLYKMGMPGEYLLAVECRAPGSEKMMRSNRLKIDIV